MGDRKWPCVCRRGCSMSRSLPGRIQHKQRAEHSRVHEAQMTCFVEAEYKISHCHCPSLSSWNSLAQIRKKASGTKPRGPQWATESEEERLEQWRWLVLHSGKTDRTCSVVVCTGNYNSSCSAVVCLSTLLQDLCSAVACPASTET